MSQRFYSVVSKHKMKKISTNNRAIQTWNLYCIQKNTPHAAFYNIAISCLVCVYRVMVHAGSGFGEHERRVSSALQTFQVHRNSIYAQLKA